MSAGYHDAMVLGGKLQGIVIEHGLRSLKAVTDTHTVEIEEPSLWAESHEQADHPKVVIKEIDL